MSFNIFYSIISSLTSLYGKFYYSLFINVETVTQKSKLALSKSDSFLEALGKKKLRSFHSNDLVLCPNKTQSNLAVFIKIFHLGLLLQSKKIDVLAKIFHLT